MVGTIILGISVAGSLTIGAFVFSQNPSGRKNQLFALLTLLFILLATFNYLSLGPSAYQPFYVRSVMAVTTFGMFILYLLSKYITDASLSKHSIWLALFTFIVTVLDYTKLVFIDVQPGSMGEPAKPIPGVGVIIYVIHFVLIGIYTALALIRGVRNSRDKRARYQAASVLIGILPSIIIGPLTGVLALFVFKIDSLIILTPIYTLIFVICVGYAIARHGLFDIKNTAVRTVAYVLSLLTLAMIYFSLAYLASTIFFKGTSTTGISMSPINIGLALVLAFLFQPVKNFFDRITNRIFFRDRYDSSEFISKLGDVLVSSTVLRTLLERAAKHIEQTLGASHVQFVVFLEGKNNSVIGTGRSTRMTQDEYDQIRQLIGENRKVLVVSDLSQALRPISVANRAVRLLVRNHVALVLPLSSEVGYLLIGEQRGRGYTQRDVRVLDTVNNELLIAIQNARSVQEVRDLNIHLQQRIDKATQELRHTNEKLRKLDETKDEFISMASHQLRTPLTSVKGYLSMVLEGDVGKVAPTQQKLLEQAFISSERMVHLIGDFLNVSRLQTGKFAIDARETDLAEVVRQEIDSMQRLAESHDMILRGKIERNIPLMQLDEDKLRQVIMNFIDNAIYYSRPKSTIVVQLQKRGKEVVLEVHDQGIGVPKEVQAKLFTKFFRADNARKQRPDGTGIGLFLARKVINAQGGEVTFTSTEGKGSVFGFRLPIK